MPLTDVVLSPTEVGWAVLCHLNGRINNKRGGNPVLVGYMRVSRPGTPRPQICGIEVVTPWE